MLSFWSQPFQAPGKALTRRELLRAGVLALPGLGAAAPGSASPSTERGVTLGRAKSCIFIFNFGGPSQLETFDLKPSAPEGRRSADQGPAVVGDRNKREPRDCNVTKTTSNTEVICGPNHR